MAKKEQSRLNINDPDLPRKRTRPARINYFNPDTYHNHESTTDMYWPRYFEAVDYAAETIKDRFDQPDWAVYKNLQQIF